MNHDLPRELQEVADQLRAAHPDPELSEGFGPSLEASLQEEPWTLRGAFGRNPLLRAAAALLLFLSVAAPGAALLKLWTGPESSPPPIRILLPTPPSSLEDPPHDLLAPVPPDRVAVGGEDLGPDWAKMVGRSNRLARAVLLWQEWERDAETLRPWGKVPPETDARALWGILNEGLASGHSRLPGNGMEARVRKAWEGRSGMDGTWLAPWMWIFDGGISPDSTENWEKLFQAALDAGS